jgi:chromosome segregation ATPase
MKLILENTNKVQELENHIEKERQSYHEYKLEITDLEEIVQNLKHENLLLHSKVEEMNFNEIELNENIKKLHENFEIQVEDLTASQQDTKSRWKDKYKNVSKELDIASERIVNLEPQLNECENDLHCFKEENRELKSKLSDFESILKEKNRYLQNQKAMLNKLTSNQDDTALDMEKNEKLFEVAINERNNKVKHLQDMIDKYKKVIDKVDANLKQLPQEFASKLLAVEKKLKREREGKMVYQEEVKALKRELLDKESQFKRHFATLKNQELKVLSEWDMNCYKSQPCEPAFKKSYNS